MKTKAKIMTGIAIGAAAGVVIGFLFAPEKGRKMRAIIAEKATDISDVVLDAYSRGKKMVGIDA